MIKNVFIVCCLFLYGNLMAQQKFDLSTAKKYAIQNNSATKKAAINSEDADLQIKEYWAIGLPKLNGNVTYQYFFEIPTQILPDFITPSIDNRLLDYQVNTASAGVLDDRSKLIPLENTGGLPAQFGTKNNLDIGLALNGLIFDGSFLVGLKAQRMYKELVDMQSSQATVNIAYNTEMAYLSVLFAEKSKEIIADDVKTLAVILNETNEIYKNGFAEKLDVDRLTLSLENLKSEVTNLDQIIKVSKNILKFNMGYPINDPIEIDDDLEQLYLKTKVEKIDTSWQVTDRVEYQLLEKSKSLSDINIERFKVSNYPNVVGAVGYSRALQTNKLFASGNEWYPTGYASIGVTVPIYDGGDRKAKIERAKIEKRKIELDQSDFTRLMTFEISNGVAQYENAERSLQLRTNNMILADNIYQTTLIKYREGVGSSLEVNQAEVEKNAAKREYLDQLYALMQAKTELDKALGKLK